MGANSSSGCCERTPKCKSDGASRPRFYGARDEQDLIANGFSGCCADRTPKCEREGASRVRFYVAGDEQDEDQAQAGDGTPQCARESEPVETQRDNAKVFPKLPWDFPWLPQGTQSSKSNSMNDFFQDQGRVEAVDKGPTKIVEWQATLQKPDKKAVFGLAHMPAKDGASVLVVAQFLEDGPVGRWNTNCKLAGKPEHMIRVGDRIVQVNGGELSVKALQAAFQADELNLRLQRFPETFELMLTKDPKNNLCGMRIESQCALQISERVLVVAEVLMNGMVDRWNKEAAKRGEHHLVVTTHMEIASACGISGTPEVIDHLSKHSHRCVWVFRRPHGGP